MHDATEGGVRAALVELATASGCGLRVNAERIPTSDAAAAIARTFGLDPFEIVGAGALVIAVAPDRAEAVIDVLAAEGIPATDVGELTERAEGCSIVRNGRATPLTHPGFDPYWRAFYRAVEEGKR